MLSVCLQAKLAAAEESLERLERDARDTIQKLERKVRIPSQMDPVLVKAHPSECFAGTALTACLPECTACTIRISSLPVDLSVFVHFAGFCGKSGGQ